MFEVAVYGIRDERRRDEHPDHAHHEADLHDHERGVSVDVADRAANLHRVGGDRSEGEKKENRGADVEQRLSEVIAHLERCDLAKRAALTGTLSAGCDQAASICY